MNRDELLRRIETRSAPWDLVIIGGGATGLGCAVDAAARGFDVLLLEEWDFGKGTSGRSSKLIHGGVRYLAAGWLRLVREGLHERSRLLANAPHLVHPLSFVIPAASRASKLWYRAGLGMYDLLSGDKRLQSSRSLSAASLEEASPNLKKGVFRGGVEYADAQFDDSRMLMHLLRTAASRGAVLVNYLAAEALLTDGKGSVAGVRARDRETGAELEIRAQCVVNAAGAFSDRIIRMARPESPHALTLSQGTHLVFKPSFWPGDRALIVPRAQSGRVLFAIPWHDHVIAGPTDVGIREPAPEPRPLAAEVDEILGTLASYLEHPPGRSDILSTWAGIRPLLTRGGGRNTARIPRDHQILSEIPGLVTIAGGKWTSYRRMAEDGIDRAIVEAGLVSRRSGTANLRLHGAAVSSGERSHLSVHGSDAARIRELACEVPELGARLHPALPYLGAEVVWAAREELARSVEDVLARRTRALMLNAQAAIEMAPRTAALLRRELGKNSAWEQYQIESFTALARDYLPPA